MPTSNDAPRRRAHRALALVPAFSLALAAGCVEIPPPGGGGSGGGAGDACTSPTAATGTREHTIVHDGLERTFLVHVPATLDPAAPAPVVFVHHGFTMSGEIMVGLTGFAEIADREGFVAVFPDGEGAYPWNAGENTCAGGPVDHETDDIGFVEAMLDVVASEACVDRDAVFVTGFSSMLHGWAGAPTFGPGTIYTGGDSYADASELIWDFFEAQL